MTNKTTKLRRTVFSMNDEARFIGYTAGQHWNGWACPYFTRDEAQKIVAYVNSTSSNVADYNLRYDASEDAFKYHDCNEDEDEVFGVYVYEDQKTGEILELYAIGSHSWTWDDMFEENGDLTVRRVDK